MANSSEDLSDKLSSDAKKKIKSINPKKVNRFFFFYCIGNSSYMYLKNNLKKEIKNKKKNSRKTNTYENVILV